MRGVTFGKKSMQGQVAAAEPGFSAHEPGFSAQRRAMVDGQIRTFDVTDQHVVQAFSLLPRERFLPPELRGFAYSDAMLTLKRSTAGGEDRVLLQPMHLARMIQGAHVEPTDRVLVVAGETGYAACLIAEMAARVVTLENDAALTQAAAVNAREFGRARVEAAMGTLSDGLPDAAPYDFILVQGAVEIGLDSLFRQLAPEGRLVAIETMTGGASRRAGKALRYQRVGQEISVRALFDATAPVIPEFRRPAAFVF